MEKHRSRTRKPKQEEGWPRRVKVGRMTVTVYRRSRADGSLGFEVANYADGKRRLESFPDEDTALSHAAKVARQMSERDVVAAAMTNEQAAEYASMVQSLAPYTVSLPSAASTLAECLKLVGDLPALHAAAKFYVARHKQAQRKRVADIVTELLRLKEARNASPRYVADLQTRLASFADRFRKDACDVTTAEIQEWLDSKKLSSQSYMNNRRVVHLLFEHAVARGYASENPVAGVESVKIRSGETEVFTPSEIQALLAAAPAEFQIVLAVGAFAGLRSAEIERLEWSDIRFKERCIVVGVSKAKTATRRVVPISDNLAAWLMPYANRSGNVWAGTHDEFYDAQQAVAAAAGFRWKQNGLRHSYASYRFALTNDAGRVAGELGNSASVVHKHYRELVTAKDAERWFAVQPDSGVSVLPAHFAASA